MKGSLGDGKILNETPDTIRARRIFGTMHNKTFFQGVTSCFLQDRCRVKEEAEPEDKSNKREVMDCNKLAKVMLQGCGIIRKRHCRAPEVLRRGKGKLSCNSGLFLRNNYLLSTTNDHNQNSFIFPKL